MLEKPEESSYQRRNNNTHHYSKSPEGKYRVISLFSGAGGMDIGVEQTERFTTLACIEKEDIYCNTLCANRDAGKLGTQSMHVFNTDISMIDPKTVMDACGLVPGELDLLIGGPPCQTFSSAGRRASIQDPRGMLLWQFLRFVEALRPKFFVMENVRGLLSAAIRHRPIHLRPDKGGPPLEPEEKPGSVVELWINDLVDVADGMYRVDCYEVNAVNYGAFQLRERVLFFGNRLGHVVNFPKPTHGNIKKARTLQKTLFEEAETTEKELLPFATLGDALNTVIEDDGEIMDFSPRKKRYLAMIPEGANWRALPEEIQKESMGKAWYATGGRSGWWRRLTRDLPCPTLVTMPNHASTAMCHPTETRALTVKECAAIQQFPPHWKFCGTTVEKYAQIGNALPVRLGQVLGEVVARHLDHSDTVTFVPSSPVPQYQRTYLTSHVRTRQWYKDGIVYTWTNGEDNSDAEYSAKKRSKPSLAGRHAGSSDGEPLIDCDEVCSSSL